MDGYDESSIPAVVRVKCTTWVAVEYFRKGVGSANVKFSKNDFVVYHECKTILKYAPWSGEVFFRKNNKKISQLPHRSYHVRPGLPAVKSYQTDMFCVSRESFRLRNRSAECFCTCDKNTSDMRSFVFSFFKIYKRFLHIASGQPSP